MSLAMMQQSEAACQRTDVPTMTQQPEAACQRTVVPTTMQQSEAAYQRTDVPTTMQQPEAACQQIDVPTTTQHPEAAYQRTVVPTMMQQSEAAYQRTDVPTTMQQRYAACQQTDVPTMMQQPEAACQRTVVPTTMQQSEAACQRTDVLTTTQQPEAACQRTDVPTMMQQVATATDSPPTGAIGSIGTVTGSHNPSVVGSSGVTFNTTYNNYQMEGPGVPSPGPPHCQKPDQEPRLGDPSCQDAGNKTRFILIKWYKKTQSYLQLNPGLPDDQRPIVGIYTKVQIKTKQGFAEEVFLDEVAYSTEYEKMFQNLKDFDRIIVFGKGGVGKSTIFDKIAYDWADETSQILNRFKLVFLLKMCALSHESDLVDATFDQLLGEDSGIAKDELDQFILANPNEVLILLDGFDEMKTKTLDTTSFGSILNALNRTRYRDCVICVSTRPSHLETLISKTLVRNPCTHVEVLGFNDEDVVEYVQKFYYKDPDSGEKLIETIQKSNTLRDFATNPMLLLLMCLLWGENKKLPETTSRLFTKAVTYMFMRKDEGKKIPTDADKRKADISETVIAIGKTALHGLMSANQRFSFQEDEFEPKALLLALKAGILTQQRVVKKHQSHNNIQFMHKTMQEYCAAKYLQSIHMSKRGFVKGMLYKVVSFGEFQNNLRQLCQTIEGVYSNEFLLRFCCGDNEKCMTDIVNLLDRKHSESRGKKPIARYQSNVSQAISRNCFLESQSTEVPLCLFGASNIPSQIRVEGDNDFRSLIYLLEIIRRSDSHMSQLARVKTIVVYRVSSVTDIDFALGYMQNLSNLSLEVCPLVRGDLEKVLSSICKQHLTSLNIEGCFALGGRAVEWAPHIQGLSTLNKLQIRSCKLQDIDIGHIALAAGNMPKLHDVELMGNYSPLGGSAVVWAKELVKMKYSCRLGITFSDLTPRDTQHIASAVHDMPGLTDLSLRGNRALGGSGVLWTQELPKMRHLNRLDLSYCNLTRADINLIFWGGGDMPRLTDLILCGNYLTKFGRFTMTWANNLQKVSHLKLLNLSQCGLRQFDIEDIVLAIENMPRLTDLDLRGNDVEGISVQLWTKKLPRLNLKV